MLWRVHSPIRREELYNARMTTSPCSLAIETSSRCGSISFGEEDRLLETMELVQPQRHNIDLMPAIDSVFRRHDKTPSDLRRIYVSIGPGSFTGLRIAVATAKLMARTVPAEVFAVPTLDVVAQNVPPNVHHLVVCLNLKRDQIYTGRFEHDGAHWRPTDQPGLRTMSDLLNGSPRPLAIVGDPLPDLPEKEPDSFDGVSLLPTTLTTPRSTAVWRLGRSSAAMEWLTDPALLLPLYARPPEAVELWAQRKGKRET